MPPIVNKSSSQSRPYQGGASRPGVGTGPKPGGAPKPGGFVSRPATGSRPPMGARPATGSRPPMGGARDARMTYINEMIKAPRVMLIDENGEQLGTVSRDEALRRASALGLDLVQMAYNPVDMLCTAKIIDYGKYMYDKQKDDKEKKKNNKSKGSKEVKMSYTIGDNDLALKVHRAEEFLDEGYTVRFSVRLKGREKIFVSKVVEKLKGIEVTLADKSKSQGVKEEPNGISLFLLPKGR